MAEIMSEEKAIIVAANPYRYYQISDSRQTTDIGNVDRHKDHLKRYGGVFWDIVPPGRLDTEWKHPEVHSGYFYIARDSMVTYWMAIEYIKRWKDIDDLDSVWDYIPQCRRDLLESYNEDYCYAILIRKLKRLRQTRKLSEFTLFGNNKRVERVQNYVIINDPGYR